MIYQNIYNIIVEYIFGSVSAGSHQELIAILLSSCLVIYCIALPFTLVVKLIKVVIGG